MLSISNHIFSANIHLTVMNVQHIQREILHFYNFHYDLLDMLQNQFLFLDFLSIAIIPYDNLNVDLLV